MVLSLIHYALPWAEEKELIKEADLLLDMLEFEAAIENYTKALSQNPLEQDIRRRMAFACSEQGKADEALMYLKEELGLFPDNQEALDLLFSLLYRAGRLEEANALLQQLRESLTAREEKPALGPLGLFILGINSKKIKNYDEAKDYFWKALKEGYDPVKCTVQSIDLDLIQGKLDSALYAIREAIQSYGSKPEFLFLHGLRFYERTKTSPAAYYPDYFRTTIKYFEEVLRIKPDFKDALFNLACLSYNFNQFREAAGHFEKLLALEPENEKIKFYLSCCQMRLSEAPQSAEDCPQKIELSKESIDSPNLEYQYKPKNNMDFILQNINNLALEFIKEGKFHEAARRFRNALKVLPESPEANFNLGMVYLWLGFFHEAEKHALLALRKDNFFGSLPPYLVRRIASDRRASLPEPSKIPLSEWTFEKALQEGNFFLEAYDLLGNIYFKKGDLEKSVLAFIRVLEINPRDAMGHYNLGCTYLALKDEKKAEEEWKKAIDYEEKLTREGKREEKSEDELRISLIVYKRTISFRAHKSLGRLYFEKYLLDQARKEFEDALKLEPGDQESYYFLGKIYQAKNDLKKAIYYFEKCLYYGGQDTEVKEILRLLKEKEKIRA